MVPEGLPEGYTLQYEQTFDTAASADDFIFANPTQWFYDPTGFIGFTGAGYAPPQASPHSIGLIKDLKFSSFVMDVELLQTSPDGDGHRDMAIIWNFVSESEYYYAHISTAHDGVAHNIHIVNNADRTAITDTYTDGYDWGRDVWQTFRVIRDVNTGVMEVYDLKTPDSPILTANDTTFTDGYIGLGSFDNTGQVGSVKIWAADSTQETITLGDPWAPLGG